MNIRFTKMQAYGNDYVYIDAINQKLENLNDLAKKISDRHFGVGSDGMVLICDSSVADFRMRIFNPDGTEAEMCGNAIRSTAKFVYYHGMTDKEELTIETLGGVKHLTLFVENGEVVNIEAEIGQPDLLACNIPVATKEEKFIDREVQVADRTLRMSSLSWGNPHTVFFVDDVASYEVQKYGPLVEYHERFPKRTNVTFAQVVDENHIKIREWERGTGETLGCGTGCCTAVVIAHLLGKCTRNVEVEQLGGVLYVRWDEAGNVHMTGPSHVVYEGEYIYEVK